MQIYPNLDIRTFTYTQHQVNIWPETLNEYCKMKKHTTFAALEQTPMFFHG